MTVDISKRNLLALLGALTVVMLAAPATAQEAAGDWIGFIEAAPGTRLPLILHIKRDDAGTLSLGHEVLHCMYGDYHR